MSFSIFSHGARVCVEAAAGPSRSFHTTALVCESHARINARRKRQRVLGQRAALKAAKEAEVADPILGSPLAGPSGSPADPSALYAGSRLQKTVLRAQDIWYSPPPNYAAGAAPTHLLPGLNSADRDLLFGALPHASAQLAFDPERPAHSAAAAGEQAHQSEALQRILDLRNASKRGIEVVNRARIVEQFGRNPTGAGAGIEGAKGPDTGSSYVQAALLTHKIRSLHEHLATNTRDTQNQRALRLLVHKRARVLKYLRRKDEAGYVALLADLGLARSAVEGELKVGM